MPQPNAAHSGGRHEHAPLSEFIGYTDLSVSGLFHSHIQDGLLDVWLHAVLQDRLAPADLFQCQLAAFFVQLLETIEAVSGITQHLACL